MPTTINEVTLTDAQVYALCKVALDLAMIKDAPDFWKHKPHNGISYVLAGINTRTANVLIRLGLIERHPQYPRAYRLLGFGKSWLRHYPPT